MSFTMLNLTPIYRDMRKNLAPVQKLTDIHTDSIRVVQFTSTHLYSAADDGLIHAYDLNNLSEDALSTVINVGNGVNRMGLIGNFIWSITHLHECQIWNKETVRFQ
jgi:WD40 repeat protein